MTGNRVGSEKIQRKLDFKNQNAEPGDDHLHLRATMRISPVISTRLAVVLLIAAALFVRSAGISAAAPVAAPAALAATGAEARASRAYQAAVHQGPLAVQAFLADFPKGADLHFHLGAGVYAETLIRVAAEDKVCIDPTKLDFARNESGKVVKEPCAPPLVAGERIERKQSDPGATGFV